MTVFNTNFCLSWRLSHRRAGKQSVSPPSDLPQHACFAQWAAGGRGTLPPGRDEISGLHVCLHARMFVCDLWSFRCVLSTVSLTFSYWCNTVWVKGHQKLWFSPSLSQTLISSKANLAAFVGNRSIFDLHPCFLTPNSGKCLRVNIHVWKNELGFPSNRIKR